MKLRFVPYVLCAAAVLCTASVSFAGGIYLRTGTIDTDVSAAAAMAGQPSLGSGYYLLQLRGPVTEADKASVTALGVELIEYIPDGAFLVRMQRSAFSKVRKLDCVKWIGPFKPEHRLSPRLPVGEGKSQYLVKLFPDQNSQYVISKGKRLGAKTVACENTSRGDVCHVLAKPSEIAELAKTGAVAWVEPYVQPTLCNDVASGISGMPEVRQSLSLFGATQLIGVADSGLDTGDTDTMHPDFTGRLYKTYSLRRPGEWSDLNGHGTHVIGSVLGSGALSGSDPATHTYSGSFAGYAPEAKLVLQSIGDSGQFVFPPLHLADLFQPTYTDGVRVHSDSWGSAVDGEYTVYSNEVDQFIWDHKDFSAIFAVGNEGLDTDRNGIIELGCLYAPATAKNCISVGATENLRLTGGYQFGYGVAWPSDYPVQPIRYDSMSNNASGMVAFSGRGPTSDGRIKPDICAPGTNIISCRAHTPTADTGWAIYNNNYIYMGGTSMSAPQVAGAAAVVREYFQVEKGISPSAALVKAALINGAVDISPGQYGTGAQREVYPAPDNSQGWGRMNVKLSICPDPPTINEFADESGGLGTGEYRDHLYTVVDNSVPLKVTLVWTDYPGSVHAAKELVNDLDLQVVSPTGLVKPLTANHTDNVEEVTIPNPELGTYLVRVTGHDVPMGPQDYALVVSGGLPGGYIAGSVTSSSGAPVQGATITLSSSGNTKHVTTNSSGKYVSHLAPGTYSIQIAKPGWTFIPRWRPIPVADAPVENVDFVGSGSPGAISGTITKAIGGVVSYKVESSHPYLNSSNQVYTVTAHQAATRIRVHFAEIDLMNDGDSIFIEDLNGNRVDTFTGKGEDVWSSWVNGSSLNVRLVSTDTGNIAYGFYVDGFETDLTNQGALAGATVTLTPGNYTATSAADGSYAISSIPPGVYSVSASMTHWRFQPPTRSIDVPAGDMASGVGFQAFPPGTITGEIRTVSSRAFPTNVQSEHDYGNYVDTIWTITGDPSANRIRLHFSRIETEPGFDWVWLLDKDENMVESYTADYTDEWTPWVNGNVAKIELVTDGGNVYWGFKCDAYELDTLGGGLANTTVNLLPDSTTATTGSGGTFAFTNVDVGDHDVRPASVLYTFDPQSATASISAGVEQHFIFYATIADLTTPAQAKSLANGTEVKLGNLIVTAVFGSCFYAQGADRVSGIKIISAQSVAEGDRVDVTGVLGVTDGERHITASVVTKR